MSDAYNSGFYAGLSGGAPPTNPAEYAGWVAGQAARERGGGSGSIEWLIAPFILAPIFAWLYPVTTAATLATAYAVAFVCDMLGMGIRSIITIAALLIPTIYVCWTVGRLDQTWGLNPAYARARHVARLVIAALVMNGAMVNARITDGQPVRGFFTELFTNPYHIGLALGTAALVHWFSRTSYSARFYWNTKLVMWKFRTKDYPIRELLPGAKSTYATPLPPLELPPQLQRLEDASRAARRGGAAFTAATVAPTTEAPAPSTTAWTDAAPSTPSAATPAPTPANSPASPTHRNVGSLRLGLRSITLRAFSGTVTIATASKVYVTSADGVREDYDPAAQDTSHIKGHRASLISARIGAEGEAEYVAIRDDETGEMFWSSQGINDVAGPTFYNMLIVGIVFFVIIAVPGSLRGESGALIDVGIALALFAMIIFRRRALRSAIVKAMA